MGNRENGMDKHRERGNRSDINFMEEGMFPCVGSCDGKFW